MIDRIKNWILESRACYGLINLSKRIRISWSSKVTLYSVILFTGRELRDNDLNAESKSVAWNFTLATFPGIIFFFTLIAFLDIDQAAVRHFIQHAVPKGLWETAQSTIENILGTKSYSWRSFGFFTALFFSTNGMVALMNSFNKCYQTRENRSWIMRRLIALGLTLMLTGVMSFVVLMTVVSQPAIEWLYQKHFITAGIFEFLNGLHSIEFVLFAGFFVFSISLIYYFGPTVKKRWRFFSLGAIVATILTLGLTAGFSYYIGKFNTYNAVYGSIGALIGFMVWIQAVSWILLFGFEINAGLEKAKIYKKRYAKTD